MSLLTLGIFWVGQQTQLQQFKRSNHNLPWILLGFLFAVTLMPFSTALLAGFIAIRSALIIYWLNIVLLGLMLYNGHRYAARANLVQDEVTPVMRAATGRRIIIAQALYAVGAALCVINASFSVAAIVLVQLNDIIASRIRPLYRLCATAPTARKFSCAGLQEKALLTRHLSCGPLAGGPVGP